jgi:DNA-directed RNA polymerase subunit beta
VSFAKLPEILDVPDLLEIQRRSYERCLQFEVPPDKRESIGLQSVFEDMLPFESYDGVFSLEYISYEFGSPKHSIEECKRRGLTYGAPLYAKLRLVVREPRATMLGQQFRFAKEQGIYLGEIPLMTKVGTFVINGSERVIVSQLHRSPGVIFGEEESKDGKRLYSARIIP